MTVRVPKIILGKTMGDDVPARHRSTRRSEASSAKNDRPHVTRTGKRKSLEEYPTHSKRTTDADRAAQVLAKVPASRWDLSVILSFFEKGGHYLPTLERVEGVTTNMDLHGTCTFVHPDGTRVRIDGFSCGALVRSQVRGIPMKHHPSIVYALHGPMKRLHVVFHGSRMRGQRAIDPFDHVVEGVKVGFDAKLEQRQLVLRQHSTSAKVMST